MSKIIDSIARRMGYVLPEDLARAVSQRDKAMQERDAARRSVCHLVALAQQSGGSYEAPMSANDYAASQGWNCFPGPANEHVPLTCWHCGDYIGKLTRRRTCWSCERELSGH